MFLCKIRQVSAEVIVGVDKRAISLLSNPTMAAFFGQMFRSAIALSGWPLLFGWLLPTSNRAYSRLQKRRSESGSL